MIECSVHARFQFGIGDSAHAFRSSIDSADNVTYFESSNFSRDVEVLNRSSTSSRARELTTLNPFSDTRGHTVYQIFVFPIYVDHAILVLGRGNPDRNKRIRPPGRQHRPRR